MAIIYLSCAWVAGIFLGAKFDLPPALILTALIPLPLLFLAGKHRKPVVLASLCLILFFSGAYYFKSSLSGASENRLSSYNDQGAVEIQGLVTGDPEPGDQNVRLRLSASAIKSDNEWHKVSGAVLLILPRYPAYRYGDSLQVRGKLETPPKLDGFDYQAYLAHQEIYSIIRYPEIEILAREKGNKLLARIYSLRNRLSQSLSQVLPEPQAALAQGIVLGIRSNIPASIKADFIRSGTAHVLAISGVNLTIVAGILLSLGIWLFGRRRYFYIWLALGIIWLYAALTGMHSPVLRAAIMASLFLSAELLGRQRSAIIALVVAAAIMAGASPQVLWDTSFQLSFMAMAGLILFFPPLQSLARKITDAALGGKRLAASSANLVADSFSVSLAATVAVAPLIAHYYGIISLVGLPATLLTLPALPGIIVAGVLSGGIGLVFMPLAQVVAWFAWLFLSYMLLVVDIFAAIPSVELSSVNPGLIWAYYSALALGVWISRHWSKLLDRLPEAAGLISRVPKKWVIPPLLATAILVSVAAATMPDDNLHVSFLDVGQGDAILIQRGSQQVLVDGGPSPQAISLGLSQGMPFWDRTIDLIVLTHPHADHLAGLIAVLNRYKVKQVLYPDLEYESLLYDEWHRLIQEKNIRYTLAYAGQQIELGDAVIGVLNPQFPCLAGTDSDIDNNSVVLRLQMGGISFLLAADITWATEMELITRRATLNSTVLKVAHHGSATSTTTEFLAAASPRIAIIQVGEGNPFGLPSQEVLARLAQKPGQENIYRTDEHGTIEFATDGERLWVRVEK